ncbi:MAG: 16S rRNA (adenine(1518)-N(6)/adenine(1519)-N(6))-dimethyltransferase RsmA [Bacilli bacterium]
MPISKPSDVEALMKMMKTAPLKRYGQNFLLDQKLIDEIITAFNPKKGENILEIGPGLGALTEKLVKSGAQVFAVEIDRKLTAFLQANFHNASNLKLINKNILQCKIHEFPTPLRIISNLPYNITTSVIEKVIKESSGVSDFYFMVQREVIGRLKAKTGDKEYGPLAILLALFTEGKVVINIPREAFYPRPHVTSTIYHFRFHHRYPQEVINGVFSLTKAMFLSRRKTIFNNLTLYLKDKNKAQITLKTLKTQMNSRPEQLDPIFYLELYQYLDF